MYPCICVIVYALYLKKKMQPPRMYDNLMSKQFDSSKLTVTFLELL